MPKVLQITSKLFRGGAESFIMNVYRNIDRERFDFDFLVFHSEREFYEDEIEALGGHVYHVPIMEGANIFRRRSMLDDFFANHATYEAVHCHMAALGGDCLAAAGRAGVQIRLAHSHVANYEHNPRGYLKRLFEKGFGNHATTLLACSEWAGRYMFGNAPFTVVNNGIDIGKFAFAPANRKAFRDSIGASESELLIGHAGRFQLMKNQAFLLEVFSEMVRSGFLGRLIFAGDGLLRKEVEGRVRELGLTNRVIFLGAIEDMPSFYSGIDLFVMPSLSEGLPFSAIEAQCSGLPCVLSDAISPECKISDGVLFLSVDAGLKQWAELTTAAVSESSIDTRDKGFTVVREAGYGITDVVNSLQKIYEGKR